MKKITEIDVKDKIVLVRVDYNVPILNGEITDNSRIIASLETINYLISQNAKIVLMSHLGKIKTEEDMLNNSLRIVKNELEKILNKEVKFSITLMGEELENNIKNLKSGEILLLENTRYMDYPDNLESGCDEYLSKYWASLGDVFILDAFGSAHRAHASTYGIAKYLPHAIGFLVEKEINELDKIKKEQKTILLGGSKVKTKIGVIKNLLPKSTNILIGGAMCGTFLKSCGFNVGKTPVEEDYIEECKELIKTDKILLPIDVVTKNGIKKIEEITDDESILDIGPITLSMYKAYIHDNELVLMNGTMGKYEDPKYEKGTKEIFNYLQERNVKVIVCGGDTVSAAKKYNFNPSYASTGGGASLEYLEGKTLPALEIMED